MWLFVDKAWGYGDPKPDHYFLALNYRMTELQGAVALAQLHKVDSVVESRIQTAEILTDLIADIPGVGTVPFMGEAGPLEPGDYITLAGGSMLAAGMGLPIPGSPPLPENLNPATGEPGVILRADEIAVINERLEAVNGIIAGVAAQFPNVHLYDMAGLMEEIYTDGYRTFGGIELSEDFLTGGIFSYDGFHPQNVGQAVVAGGLIDFINDEFNADIPQLDMYSILTEGDWQSPSPFKCGTCDPKEVVLTEEGFMQLYRLVAPDLAALMDRRPSMTAQQPVSVD